MLKFNESAGTIPAKRIKVGNPTLDETASHKADTIPSWLWATLRCPCCQAELARVSDELMICQGGKCDQTFPIVDGSPILINEKNSLFRIDEIAGSYIPAEQRQVSAKSKFVQKVIPRICTNVGTKQNYRDFADQVVEDCYPKKPRVLVVGGATEGGGMAEIASRNDIEFVDTDVYYGPRSNIICDGHDLPFEDATFDGVLIQAVLEHVLDPVRCVEEIHRVLKPDGMVYAESAFLQSVHEGQYDFMRFTDLGHRRLFRKFSEVRRGIVMGPGAGLAWSYRTFLLSFFDNKYMLLLTRCFAHATSFWLKYLDYHLVKRRGGLDGGCQVYFLGRHSHRILDDRALIADYRGNDKTGIRL
jgi:SAM-dependent methyltransferase